MADALTTELHVLQTDGFVVLPGLLGAAEIDAIRGALAPHLASTPKGRNRFEGLHSQRVYAPRRVQELLGYSLHVPFKGHVNGLHPLRLIDPRRRQPRAPRGGSRRGVSRAPALTAVQS